MTDDLNRLRAVTLTDEEMDSILNADSRSHMFRRVESIVAARTAALLDRVEHAEREVVKWREAMMEAEAAKNSAEGATRILRAAVTNLADSYEQDADESENYGGELWSTTAAALRSLLAAAPTETEGENT